MLCFHALVSVQMWPTVELHQSFYARTTNPINNFQEQHTIYPMVCPLFHPTH